MPSNRDPGAIEPAADDRSLAFEPIQPVENRLEILLAEAPKLRAAGVVRGEAKRPRVQMGRLNHDKAVYRPVIGKRAISVQRLAVSVREDDDWQAIADVGRGYPNLKVEAARRRRDRDGGKRDDWRRFPRRLTGHWLILSPDRKRIIVPLHRQIRIVVPLIKGEVLKNARIEK
jgi:hypothetical protein